MGVYSADLTEEREDPYAIGKHGKGTPLVRSLLAVQEVAGSIHVTHHQSGPVAIAVESELCATGPLKLGSPHNRRLILIIKRALCVNEEESPVLILGMLLPQEVHHMDAPSMHVSIPLQIWSFPHAFFSSCPSTFRTQFAIKYHQFSPTPTDHTPGCLSIPIKRPYRSVR